MKPLLYKWICESEEPIVKIYFVNIFLAAFSNSCPLLSTSNSRAVWINRSDCSLALIFLEEPELCLFPAVFFDWEDWDAPPVSLTGLVFWGFPAAIWLLTFQELFHRSSACQLPHKGCCQPDQYHLSPLLHGYCGGNQIQQDNGANAFHGNVDKCHACRVWIHWNYS